MEKALFEVALGNSIWAGLFVLLFCYVIYDSRAREKKYQITISENQKIIAKLSEKFSVVEDIENKVDEIDRKLDRRG